MKKDYLLVVALIFIVFSLSACSGTSKASDNSAKNKENVSTQVSEDANQNTSEGISEDQVCGTYVGAHGSGLTLHEDGSADYYWKQLPIVEQGDSWEISDRKIVFSSNILGYDISATLPNGQITSLTFESDDEGWDDETFMKASDDTKTLTRDEYISLIESTLKTKLYEEYKLGDMTFSIPPCYIKNDQLCNEENGVIGFISSDFKNNTALLVLTHYKANALNADEASDRMDDILKKSIIVSSESDVEVEDISNDSLIIKRKTAIGENNEQLYKEIAYIVYDGKEVYYAIMFQSPKECDLFSEDLDSIINSGIESDPNKISFDSSASDSDSSSSSNTSSSSSVDGVRPEVKEAIDSYEEFFDEYIEIMNKMKEEPSNMEILTKYTEYMSKYTETMQKFEELKDSDFNDAETLYYTEVSLRIEQKLLEAMK